MVIEYKTEENNKGKKVDIILIDGKRFKPVLFPSEQVDPLDFQYPLFVSEKRDGHRILVTPMGLKSRNFKDEPNKYVRKKWQQLVEFCKFNELILDGELDDEDIPFNEVSSVLRSFEKPLTPGMNIYLFDVLRLRKINEPFYSRLATAKELAIRFGLKIVIQKKCSNSQDVENMFNKFTETGGEGLILRSIKSKYKFGRYTINQGMGYKLKLIDTFDAKVIDIQQRMKNVGEREIDELGYMKTSSKIGDMQPVDMAGALIVDYNGHNQKVTLAMTDEEKTELWKNKGKYIGRWIEFKGMLVGSKDKVRHPVFVRWREDK